MFYLGWFIVIWIMIALAVAFTIDYYEKAFTNIAWKCSCGAGFDKSPDENSLPGKTLLVVCMAVVLPIIAIAIIIQCIRWKLHKRSCLVGLVK